MNGSFISTVVIKTIPITLETKKNIIDHANNVDTVTTAIDHILLERHLKKPSLWAGENDLGVNTKETKRILFTTMYKIPDFRAPLLAEQKLVLSGETKYLGDNFGFQTVMEK